MSAKRRSRRPNLKDRQWWLLNAFSYGAECHLMTIMQRGGYRNERPLIEDVKCLAEQDLISGATMTERRFIVAKPTQRGRTWARKWRREQVENL